MLLRYCALVAVLVSLFSPLRAADPIGLQEVSAAVPGGLKGVSVVGVLLESLNAEEIRAGLTEDQLLQDVQLKLRQNGLRVIDPLQATGYLYLNVNCVYNDKLRFFAYNIHLGFRQAVRLMRQPQTLVPDATTWRVDATGIVPEEKLITQVRSSTANLVDRFLNAYLAENPKK